MQVNAKPVIIYTNLQQNHKHSHLKIVHTNSEQPYLLQYKGILGEKKENSAFRNQPYTSTTVAEKLEQCMYIYKCCAFVKGASKKKRTEN